MRTAKVQPLALFPIFGLFLGSVWHGNPVTAMD